MKPAAVLGFDPTPPGDPATLDGVTDALHRVMRGLVMSRRGLESIGNAGSTWDGAAGAAIVTVIRRYTISCGELEEVLVECLQALEAWRRGTDERQRAVARVVESVADLAGVPSVDDRRARLLAQARDIQSEHQRDAASLVAAFESLSTAAGTLTAAQTDLAGELDAAILAMTAAVDRWIEQEGPELLRSTASLSDVAGLTTVIFDLVGVAALKRIPGDAAGATAVAAGSPAAHRLIKALHRRWLEGAPQSLPDASFASLRRTDLSDALAGGAGQSSEGRASGGRADADAG